MFKLNHDYEIKFKATKKLFNLFNIRRTFSVLMNVEELDKLENYDGAIEGDYTTETEELQQVINEYARIEKLTDVKLIQYTRYVR